MALVFGTDPEFQQRPVRQLPTPEEGTQSSSVSAGRPGAPFEDLASIIPNHRKHYFTTPTKAGDFVRAKLRQSRGLGCYLLITDVSEDDVRAIDELLHGLHLGYSIRHTYENALKSLILKCMLDMPHETASRTFYIQVLSQIAAIPGHNMFSVASVGSTRFETPGKRSKEADGAMMPKTRPPSGWPSLVFEVGYSESLPALLCDARWWLVNSGGETRMVVIIRVTGNPRSLHVETWEMVPNPNVVPTPSRRSTRQTPATVPGCTQVVDIDAAATIRPPGFVLRIPYLAVFDVAHPSAVDITLSANELSETALHIYDRMAV